MIDRVRVLACGVLGICMLSIAPQGITPVEASTSSAVPKRFFSVLLPPEAFAFAMQAVPDVKKNVDVELPDGPGKEVTKRLCTKCHGANVWAQQRHTREKWSSIIDNMVSKGMEASDDELDQVNDYLATHFAPPADSAPSK